MSVFFNTFSISFYAAFIAMLGMVSFKVFEMHSGKRSWISRVADSTNHIVHAVYDGIKKALSHINRKGAIALIQWIAYHILSWARETYIWAYKKAHAHAPSKKVIDMVRGRVEINKNGGSSIYLKKISDNSEEEALK